jgi:predicted PurR-regulated permease PerM
MANIDGRFGRRASDRDPGWRQILTALRVVLVVVAVAAILWLIFQLRTVILLVVLSIFFAYLVAPLVDLVNRPLPLGRRQRRLSPGVAVGVVYLLIIGGFVIALAWLAPQISDQASQMASQAPSYVQAVQERGHAMAGALDRIGLGANSKVAVERAFTDAGRALESAGRNFLMSFVALLTYLPWLILIPILAFFLLKDAMAFREAAICLLPEGRVRSNATQLFDRVNAALAAYIRAQLLACLIVGTVTTVGFVLLGVPYALVLGVGAGLAEFIPLVGPLVVAIVATVIAAVHDPLLAVWVLVFLGVLRLLEDYVVYPRLVGKVIDLHPLAVVLAVLSGAELGGVAGIFLSVPVVAILSAGYRQFLAYTRSRAAADRAVESAEGGMSSEGSSPIR